MPPIKRLLSSKVFLFFLLLAVIWLGIVLVRTAYRRYQLDQEVSSLKSEIDKLDKKDNELSQLIKYFNNQSFLEREAKDKLNLKKEGESVVMVPEAAISQELSENITSSEPKAEVQKKPADNNFIKWWKYLFGR